MSAHVTAADAVAHAAPPLRAVHSVPLMHPRRGTVARAVAGANTSPGNRYGLGRSITLATGKSNT